MLKKCPVCKENSGKKYFKSDKTIYYKCNICNLVFTDKLTTDEYSSYHRFEEYQRWEGYLKNHFLWIVKQIEKLNNKKLSILEIGSSVGFLQDVIKEKGHEVIGVEPSLNAVEFARKRGHNTIHSYFEDAKVGGQKFDVIIANHVFEHIKIPENFLKKTHKHLRPKGGSLVLLLPNFGSLEAAIFKSRWRFLIPKEHYMQYTPTTLKHVLEKNSFEVIRILTTSTVTGLGDYKKEYKRSLLSDPKRFIFYLIEAPWALFQQLLGRGTNLCVISRPRTK